MGGDLTVAVVYWSKHSSHSENEALNETEQWKEQMLGYFFHSYKLSLMPKLSEKYCGHNTKKETTIFNLTYTFLKLFPYLEWSS